MVRLDDRAGSEQEFGTAGAFSQKGLQPVWGGGQGPSASMGCGGHTPDSGGSPLEAL